MKYKKEINRDAGDEQGYKNKSQSYFIPTLLLIFFCFQTEIRTNEAEPLPSKESGIVRANRLFYVRGQDSIEQ